MRQRPTVADLRALKGGRQLTMLGYFWLEEAGIDVGWKPSESQRGARAGFR